jgi:hypothetical protein
MSMKDINIISTIVEYDGMPIKIEGDKIYLRAFGTTLYDHTMHWSWIKIEQNNLKPEIKKLLKRKGLI